MTLSLSTSHSYDQVILTTYYLGVHACVHACVSMRACVYVCACVCALHIVCVCTHVCGYVLCMFSRKPGFLPISTLVLMFVVKAHDFKFWAFSRTDI